MKEVISNMNNAEKNKISNDQSIKLLVKPAFIPLKNKIQSMEKDQAKSKSESEEFIQKHKTIAQKLIENFDDEPKIEEEKSQKEKKVDESNGHPTENGSVKIEKSQTGLPPKPLPRKSISDQGSSFEENSVVPRPKPRTACPNFTYKVYLLFQLCVQILSFLR